MKWPADNVLSERTAAFIAGRHGKRGEEANRELALAMLEIMFHAHGLDAEFHRTEFLGVLMGRGIVAGGIKQMTAEAIMQAIADHPAPRRSLPRVLPPDLSALCASKGKRLDAHLDAIWEKTIP